MKKNFEIQLHDCFYRKITVNQLRQPAQGVSIRHAERSYFQSEQQEAILQEFDGRVGYLYSMETTLHDEMNILIRTKQRDMHILYLMQGTSSIQLMDKNNNVICDLVPERSCYLYLPAGDYILCVSNGWSHIFGFYFDGGIFRHGNEKEFPFLTAVLDHYRSISSQAMASVDFWVGPRTKTAIMHLCRNLKWGVLSNEDFISRNIYRLIDISKKKFTMPPTDDIQHSYIQAGRQRIYYALEDGDGIPSLQLIASDLGISLDHLNKLHQEAHHMTLRDYAKSLLVDLAIEMLKSGMSVTEVSNHFNYSDCSAFARIIKAKTGKPPSYWTAEKKNK